MKPATRLMMMSNTGNRNGNANMARPGQDYQTGDFSAMTGRAGREGVAERVGAARESGSTMRERGNAGYMGGAERRGGMRDIYGREDDDEEYGGNRMYAAGMAWTDPKKDKKHHKERHEDHEEEVDEQTAMEWVHGMKAADGSQMPRYKHEQAEQMRKAYCPECEEWEWFTAVNMMYADYSEAAKKFNVNRDEFYALMAKAFLMDEDAAPHKLARYMEEIPKK